MTAIMDIVGIIVGMVGQLAGIGWQGILLLCPGNLVDFIERVIEQDILVLCPGLAMCLGSCILNLIGCILGPIGKVLNLFFG